MAPSQSSSTTQRGFRFRIPEETSRFSVLLIIVGGIAALLVILLLAVYAWQERAANVFAIGAVMAMAATAIASVAGFLFGLPRYSDAAGSSGSSIVG